MSIEASGTRVLTRRHGIGAGVFALALAALAPAAHAAPADYCADSFDALQDALQRARTSPLNIEIVQGTYHIASNGGGIAIAAGANLRGGYTAGCTGRDIALGNTVITGDFSLHPRGDLTIEGLTWHASLSIIHETDFGDDDVPPGSEVLIRRSAFIDASEGGGVRVEWIADDDGASVRIVDSVVAGNSLEGVPAIDLYGSGDDSLSFELVNDTVVDNLQGDGISIQIAGSGATAFVDNTIAYGNDQGGHHDLVSDSASLSLVADDIGTHSYPTPIFPPIGVISADPRLDAQYRPIESPPSPVIDAGTSEPRGGLPATDLPGHTRVIGLAPDIGAYESNIDNAYLQTVTTTSDAGSGSLRSALTSVIAHGSGLIRFDIAGGCGPHVIKLNSPLPPVTVPVIVNGYTQSGAAPNTLDTGTNATFCVILEANDASATKGLQIPTNAGDAVALVVKGLAFSGFTEAAIALGAGDASAIMGNRFGGSVGGHALTANGAGIRIDANAHDTLIGSDDAADRNIIGGATNGSGVLVFGSLAGSTPSGSHANEIANNLIGVDWSGGANGAYIGLGNGARGIYVAGYGNDIHDNVIGDNTQAGIFLANGGAADNTIEHNLIGFASGGHVFANGAAGIHLGGDPGDAPDGNTIRYNTIADNAAQGVWIEIGRENRTRHNTTYGNGGLGIDLGIAGVLANDNDGDVEPPDFPNRGQNYPQLSGALGGRASGAFTGVLESTLGDYRIDFYQLPAGCPAGDNRQGGYWIGSQVVSITKVAVGGDGAASIGVNLRAGDYGTLVAGAGISATATDGAGNSSELSPCVVYVDDQIFADGFDPRG